MKKDKKAQAGLQIFLSLIIMLFLVGLIIMIFSIMGVKLRESSYTPTSGANANELIVPDDSPGTALAVSGYRDVTCSIVSIYNATSQILIGSTNYTLTGCNVLNKTNVFPTTAIWKWNVSYTYRYNADNTATETMNDTIESIVTSIDFFDIFVVIGAMVVLILLVVMIVSSIKNSGLMEGKTKSNPGVGTA
jgi:hypothetical protein